MPVIARCNRDHAATRSSLSTPRATICNASSGNGRCSALASSHGARIHLIIRGADPRRILLMTFSRRAASEMAKRVERIARKVLGDNAGIMTDALTWAGTYHGIGARLLREYA